MRWIYIVVILLAGAAVVSYIIARLSRLFGKAEDLIGRIKDADVREQETPKSLNAMDSLLLPQIMKDFPEYNRAMLEERVIRDAGLYYESALAGRVLLDKGVSFSLRDGLLDKLPGDVKGGISVRRVALAAYDRRGRDKLITYQAAVQYEGKDERRRQKRLSLTYIASYVSDPTNNIEVIKCPNCGAPVPTMGEKVCSYCGSALTVYAGAGWVLIKLNEE